MHLQFENPAAFLGLWGVAALGAFMWWQARRFPGSLSRRRFALVGLSFVACIIALARPQMGHFSVAQKSLRSNLFLALDISKSMLAEDISPSRLGFMAAFSRKLLETLPGIRVAIFPFAGDGYLQMPLSTDLQAAGDLITSLNPTMVTSQGTDFNASLDTLLEMILHMEGRAKETGSDWAPTQVLLISDGETHRPVEESLIRKYRAQHIPIFTVGVGTTAGAFIPIEARFGANRENLRDREGRTVRSKLEPESLRKIAHLSDGDYFSSRFEEVYQLANRLTQSMQIGKLTATFKAERELFPIFLIAAVILFTLELACGRWEYLLRAVLPLLLCFGWNTRSAAMSDETQAELQRSGNDRAIKAYDLGIERGKQGNQPESAELFQESASTARNARVRKQALFNLGNSILRLGDPVQAIQAYQQAIDVKTGDPKFDKEANDRISQNIVLAAKMEEQKQQQQKEKEGEGDEKQGANDPHGPTDKYQPQFFDDVQKQRIFDLVSGEEQQILQRLQGKKNKKPLSPTGGKEW